MGISLDLYRVFREVARAGSFSGAARALFMSQSAVSQSIAQLEAQLGVRLFSRTRRGAALTAEGEALFGPVNAALGMLSTGVDRLERMRQLSEGKLAIGAGDAISQHYLLPLLARFQGLYPAVRLQVVNRTTLQAVEQLKSGRIDLAFVNLPLADDDLDLLECMKVHDVFVAAPGCLPAAAPRTPADLAACRLIMLERLSLSRRYVDEFFLQNGVRLQPEIELGAYDLLLEFARVGLGVSCVVREFTAGYLQSGALTELAVEPPVPERGIGLCTLRGVGPSAAAQRFIELIEPTKERNPVSDPRE